MARNKRKNSEPMGAGKVKVIRSLSTGELNKATLTQGGDLDNGVSESHSLASTCPTSNLHKLICTICNKSDTSVFGTNALQCCLCEASFRAECLEIDDRCFPSFTLLWRWEVGAARAADRGADPRRREKEPVRIYNTMLHNILVTWLLLMRIYCLLRTNSPT